MWARPIAVDDGTFAQYPCSTMTDDAEAVCYGVPHEQRPLVCLDDASPPDGSGDGRSAASPNDEESVPVWAIVLIAVFSGLILVVSVGLVGLVAASVILCLRMRRKASYDEV